MSARNTTRYRFLQAAGFDLLPLNRCISDFRVVGMPLGLRLSSLSYRGKPGSHLVVGVDYHSGSHLGRVFSGDPRVTHLTCGNAFLLHATDYQPKIHGMELSPSDTRVTILDRRVTRLTCRNVTIEISSAYQSDRTPVISEIAISRAAVSSSDQTPLGRLFRRRGAP